MYFINIIDVLVVKRRHNAIKLYYTILQYRYIPKHLLSFTIYSYIFTYFNVLLIITKAINLI